MNVIVKQISMTLIKQYICIKVTDQDDSSAEKEAMNVDKPRFSQESGMIKVLTLINIFIRLSTYD